MFNFTGLSNSKIQAEDIKIMAANKIRFSPNALETIGAKIDEQRIFIDKDRNSGKFYIAAIDVVRDASSKIISEGIAFNSYGAFSHTQLATKLGGANSVWSIAGEGVVHEGVTYFEIIKSTDAEEVKVEMITETETVAQTDYVNHDNTVMASN